MKIRENVPLASMTTLGVGGAARFWLDAESEADVAEAFAWAKAQGIAATVLGGGSNVVVADEGFDGFVVRVRVLGREVLEAGGTPSGAREATGDGRARDASNDGDRVDGTIVVRVGAGEPLDSFVAECVAAGWAGVECLSGIPGYIGATPIQNVGAYGQEVAETIVEVFAIERSTGRGQRFTAAECGFAYRTSVFKGPLRDRFVVTSVTFALWAGGAPTVRYPELVRSLPPRPTLAEVREMVLGIRRSKSMVIEPGDPNGQSVGSFFVNPVVASAVADAIAADAADMPRYPAGAGSVKLSAAWLIERAGFVKGTSAGRVGISSHHALALVNRGGATAAEIVAFAARVRDAVRSRFGVTLDPEPVFVGFAPADLA